MRNGCKGSPATPPMNEQKPLALDLHQLQCNKSQYIQIMEKGEPNLEISKNCLDNREHYRF